MAHDDVDYPAFLEGLPGASDTVFFGHSTGSSCHIHAHEESFVLSPGLRCLAGRALAQLAKRLRT